jgi:nitrogen-specific signal transduction histidine kinase
VDDKTPKDPFDEVKPHLAEAIRQLKERDRQLQSYHEIAQLVVSTFDLEHILDVLSHRIVETGILRSVTLALVNESKQEIVVVRSLRLDPENDHLRHDPTLKPGELAKHMLVEETVLGFRYDLDDANITAVAAKTGELQILESSKDDRLDDRFDTDPENWEQTRKVAYFIPVKHGDRVVAVIATASHEDEREQTLERIDLMEPLLDLCAIALHNARLYRDLEESNKALRENEQKLVRLERHRALGEMSAGISHNLNNILTGIIGPAQLMKQITEDAKIQEEADHIIRAGERAQNLVYRLYRSAKGDTGDLQERVDVNSLVKEAIQGSRPRWKDEADARGAPIQIMTDLGDISDAHVTASGLNDILINLIFNAIDAMDVGGTITISTAPLRDGVELRVEDTGHGMDRETRERVFEPFFTTKQDVGTGLGLSTVYGTINRWGGRLRLKVNRVPVQLLCCGCRTAPRKTRKIRQNPPNGFLWFPAAARS